MIRKLKSFFSGLYMLYFTHAFNAFSEILSLVLMKQDLNKTLGYLLLSEPDSMQCLLVLKGEVMDRRGHLLGCSRWSIEMYLHVLVPGGLFVYGFSSLTGFASTFVGCTFWSLDYILVYCFPVYSSLPLVLWIFLMLSGPQKFNRVGIFLKTCISIICMVLCWERRLQCVLICQIKSEIHIAIVENYFWKSCFEIVFRPWNISLGICRVYSFSLFELIAKNLKSILDKIGD